MGYNHKLHIKEDQKLHLDDETFQPSRKTYIMLEVLSDVQHDGHPWHKADIEYAETVLVENIISELRPFVINFVTKANPFAGHSF
jgi:hypothetical protein